VKAATENIRYRVISMGAERDRRINTTRTSLLETSMRYAEFVIPSTYVRDPIPNEAALVVHSDEVADLWMLITGQGGCTLVERAQPGPNLPVMHYIKCRSPLDAKRLERAWRDHRLSRYVGRTVRGLWGDERTDEED
jgi:hypothetical protein